jgi:competence transcription factor ComK
MKTDTQKLEWIAEHIKNYSIGIDNSAKLTYYDDDGVEVSVSVESENNCISCIELLNLALEKAMA